MITLLAYYTMGTLLFPMGDLSFMRDLPQMYHHCTEEDPDINLCNFVFEHLMNIHDDDEQESNERPHQPVFNHNPVQTFITFSATNVKLPSPIITREYIIKDSYPCLDGPSCVSGYLSEVFHPPAA